MSEITQRTRPHIRVEKALNKMGIEYQSEVGIFPPYLLDIFLPEYHLCIEVDGLGHRKKHDKVRDEWMLERYGVATLRIRARGAWQSQSSLETKILAFLEEQAPSYEERRNIWLTLK